MTRSVVTVVLLTAVYALMLSSADPADLATGALLATVVDVSLRRAGVRAAADASGPSLPRRLLSLPGFAGMLVLETVRGTWQVTLIVLGIRPLRRPGIVVIPFAGRTRAGAVVSGVTDTITPGELLIDIDEERELILMHVLDASDPDAIREQHRIRYERRQKGLAP